MNAPRLYPYVVPMPALILMLSAGRYLDATAYCSIVAMICWRSAAKDTE